MQRRTVKSLKDVLAQLIREQGLETPLLQKRLIDAWPKVAGKVVARYTGSIFISDQVLHVKILNPALRQDLTMMRSQLLYRLNAEVGTNLITDVHIY